MARTRRRTERAAVRKHGCRQQQFAPSLDTNDAEPGFSELPPCRTAVFVDPEARVSTVRSRG